MRAALIAALLLSSTPVGTAAAYCRMTTDTRMPERVGCVEECITTGIPLAWARRCNAVHVNERGSKDLDHQEVGEIVERAFAAWTDVRCDGEPVDLQLRVGSELACADAVEFRTDGCNMNLVNFESRWEERDLDPAAFALTTVWHSVSRGEILDVDMEINENRGTYGVCPEPDGCTDGTIDLPSVITHEAGHFYGLGHTSDDEDATMWACADEGEVFKRTLAPDDIDGLCAIHPPGSLPTECSFEPRGGLDLGCGCGCVAVGRGHAPPLGAALIGLLALCLLAVRR